MKITCYNCEKELIIPSPKFYVWVCVEGILFCSEECYQKYKEEVKNDI